MLLVSRNDNNISFVLFGFFYNMFALVILISVPIMYDLA